MTDRARLTQLLEDSIAKSEKYIQAVRLHGQNDSPVVTQLGKEWEAAEEAYMALLDKIKDSLHTEGSDIPDGIPVPAMKGFPLKDWAAAPLVKPQSEMLKPGDTAI